MQRIYAHRGASGYRPENTLEAFQLAIDMGADGIELDVHLTKDGEILVAHDETIDRVSDGSGVIKDMTLAQVKGFSFGKGFPGFEDAKAPTLREVYELLQPTNLRINVELKNTVFPYHGLERKCLALARDMGMTDRVLYSSFNHHSLMQVKALDRDIPCGLLYSATMVRPWAYAVALGMDALHPHMTELLIPGECDLSRRAGLMVNPWTVNEEEHLRLCFLAGADIVITNYPDRARKVLEGLMGNGQVVMDNG